MGVIFASLRNSMFPNSRRYYQKYMQHNKSSTKYHAFAILERVKCWKFKYYFKAKEKKKIKRTLKRKNTAKILSQESRMAKNIIKRNEQKLSSMHFLLYIMLGYLKADYLK